MTMIRSPPSIKCINRESPKTQIAKFFLGHGILISCFLANLYFSKIGDPTNFDTFRPEPSGLGIFFSSDGGGSGHGGLLLLLSGPHLLFPPAGLPPARGQHRGPLLHLLLPPLLSALSPTTGVVTRAAPRVFTRVL